MKKEVCTELLKEIYQQDSFCKMNNTPEGCGCVGCPGEYDKICADTLRGMYGKLP